MLLFNKLNLKELTMCDFNSEIIFCTCENKSNLSETKLFWTLIRVNEKKNEDWMDMTIGRCLSTAESIEDINDKLIESKLNKNNCFDFNYHPNEKDYLMITNEKIKGKNYSHQNPYLCFMYSDNKWEIKHFLDLDIEIEKIRSGKLKITTHNNV